MDAQVWGTTLQVVSTEFHGANAGSQPGDFDALPT
jgi:hypothetical protein